ncbi:hypothetical protein CEXT_456491 [Caerostris extrusa]|uniref:Secreted protein n=1 Tax=Caerostris extrusa TaxID=172846 RepID=A0AAV4Y2P3_CAEEX|nr:hypothetical protein CEXT_456491 [Caerostris extrusa]
MKIGLISIFDLVSLLAFTRSAQDAMQESCLTEVLSHSAPNRFAAFLDRKSKRMRFLLKAFGREKISSFGTGVGVKACYTSLPTFPKSFPESSQKKMVACFPPGAPDCNAWRVSV